MKNKFLKSLKVLLVEDEEKLSSLLKNAIGDNFKSFFIAKDGLEGLKIYHKFLPDIIITDIMMPGASGFDLIREIRNINRNAKILSMTGKGGFQNESEAAKVAKSMNADDILQKPFEFYVLAMKVQKLLGIKPKTVG